MDVSLVSRVLWQRRVLRSRERWTGPELAAYQRRQLAVLRDFAVTSSPFYRGFHHGLERAPLGELPVLTKATMMDSFDQISTDPALHLADLQAYLEQPGAGPVFGGRYWVAATSGSSGRKAIIPASAAEWAAVIASYGRASEWTGVRAGPAHPVRMVVVSSATPWHQSARVAASVRSPSSPPSGSTPAGRSTRSSSGSTRCARTSWWRTRQWCAPWPPSRSPAGCGSARAQ